MSSDNLSKSVTVTCAEATPMDIQATLQELEGIVIKKYSDHTLKQYHSAIEKYQKWIHDFNANRKDNFKLPDIMVDPMNGWMAKSIQIYFHDLR